MKSKFASTVIAALGLLPGIASAHGIGLPSVGFAAGGTGLTSFYIIGFELGPWQEYLAQELTPEYMLPDESTPVRVSWLRNGDVALLPEFASGMETRPETWLNLQFEYQSADEFMWQGVEPEDQVGAGQVADGVRARCHRHRPVGAIREGRGLQ